MILVMLFIGFGGLKFYESKQEDAFITNNFEFMNNFELLEEFEILQYLEEIENV